MKLLKYPVRPPPRRDLAISYLKGHFRYSTCNSWNGMTSYANNIKVSHLPLPNDVSGAVYALMDDEEESYEITGFSYVLRQFGADNQYRWQIGSNGRSAGYLVLYTGGSRHAGYWSYCRSCGQRNFLLVPPTEPEPVDHIHILVQAHPGQSAEQIFNECLQRGNPVAAFYQTPEAVVGIMQKEIWRLKDPKAPRYSLDNKCGKCGRMTRVNYATAPIETYTNSTGTDEAADFEDWETDDLKSRAQLVWDFDKACDDACQAFVECAAGRSMRSIAKGAGSPVHACS